MVELCRSPGDNINGVGGMVRNSSMKKPIYMTKDGTTRPVCGDALVTAMLRQGWKVTDKPAPQAKPARTYVNHQFTGY